LDNFEISAEAVMAIPAGDKEHQEVMQAIDEFEEGVKVKPQGDKRPYYCVKYCRGCELVCPGGAQIRFKS